MAGFLLERRERCRRAGDYAGNRGDREAARRSVEGIEPSA
jgi:hypothetical protein